MATTVMSQRPMPVHAGRRQSLDLGCHLPALPKGQQRALTRALLRKRKCMVCKIVIPAPELAARVRQGHRIFLCGSCHDIVTATMDDEEEEDDGVGCTGGGRRGKASCRGSGPRSSAKSAAHSQSSSAKGGNDNGRQEQRRPRGKGGSGGRGSHGRDRGHGRHCDSDSRRHRRSTSRNQREHGQRHRRASTANAAQSSMASAAVTTTAAAEDIARGRDHLPRSAPGPRSQPQSRARGRAGADGSGSGGGTAIATAQARRNGYSFSGNGPKSLSTRAGAVAAARQPHDLSATFSRMFERGVESTELFQLRRGTGGKVSWAYTPKAKSRRRTSRSGSSAVRLGSRLPPPPSYAGSAKNGGGVYLRLPSISPGL